MNIPEAARRLNVAESHITSIRVLDSGGHVVTLRSGQLMLVSRTTARVFVPEVDEPAVVEAEPEPVATEAVAPAKPADKSVVVEKPKTQPKAQRKGKANGPA